MWMNGKAEAGLGCVLEPYQGVPALAGNAHWLKNWDKDCQQDRGYWCVASHKSHGSHL